VGADGAKPLRRGLPRVPGGEPWPPAGLAPTAAATAGAASAPEVIATDAAATTVAETPAAPIADTSAVPVAEAASAAAAQPVPVVSGTATGVPLSEPLPFRRTVWSGAAARAATPPAAEPQRIGPFTRGQWAGAVIVGGAGLLYAAGMAVLAVRWLLSTAWGVDFLAAYPGEYHLPEGAPVGLPAWLGWQHFFNVFLMVLIIRTGLRVRTEKRPTVFWSPRNNGRRKISLNLWFHQSLDILWLVNGAVFVALLFVTGQWMRIVPTSWEVFPNAVSAALQYVSLDWPTENGWVNYNSLQQLAYFATVFIAAPLAAITGVRMSGVWPKNAAGLNKAYPVEWARAVHFPVMLYFVVFIAIHVFLVFATGALRNLNHMYAAQGSVDPNAYADNWTGFWFFALSLVVIAVAWVAARPLVLAPIARLFGKVSGR
jgi:thiosulfate reductase cytochrome b subunit